MQHFSILITRFIGVFFCNAFMEIISLIADPSVMLKFRVTLQGLPLTVKMGPSFSVSYLSVASFVCCERSYALLRQLWGQEDR